MSVLVHSNFQMYHRNCQIKMIEKKKTIFSFMKSAKKGEREKTKVCLGVGNAFR